MRKIASELYRLARAGRDGLYNCGLLPIKRVPVPVVSVGGLEAGGTGKTPIAHHILRVLSDVGHNSGLLTRGYQRESSGLQIRRPGDSQTTAADVAAFGDEAAMLVAAGDDLAIAASAQRIIGARALIDECGCDVIVMDDGFSHRALHRDLEVVVLRADAPFGDGLMLPVGKLRHHPHDLARAQIIWLHDGTGNSVMPPPASVLDNLRRFAPHALFVCSTVTADNAFGEGDEVVPLNSLRAVAAAGIANPDRFFQMLTGIGVTITASRSYADHYGFDPRDAEALVELATNEGVAAVLVTAKDAIKLRDKWPANAPARLLSVPVSVAITYGAEALAQALNNVFVK